MHQTINVKWAVAALPSVIGVRWDGCVFRKANAWITVIGQHSGNRFVCVFVSAVYHLTDRTSAKIIPLRVTISRRALRPDRRLILPRSGQEPWLAVSSALPDRYADFLNCSNRSASRARSGRSSPRLGISNSSREYKETPVGGNAGVSETDDHGELGGIYDRPVDRTVGHDQEFRLHDR